MGKIKLILMSVIVLASTATLFSDCGASTNSQPYWLEANGFFYTDDIRMAQDKIPFTIVLPQYLPEGMGRDYHFQIYGPLNSENLTEVEIEIEYSNGDKEIDISETNKEQGLLQNQELDPVVLDLSVGQVLRENDQVFTNSGTIEGYNYRWNQGGFSFSLRVFSFNNDEGVKIVESMAEQLIP
jgi:uncharacterized protein YwgA